MILMGELDSCSEVFEIDSFGIVLVNFENAVDMSAFEPAVMFRSNFDRPFDTCIDCPKLISGSYRMEQEYYSCASVAHQLLFGKPLEIDPGARVSLRHPLKSYWSSVWEDVFDSLLNGSAEGIVEQLEEFMVISSKGKSLKSLMISISESLPINME
jgi:hypothetical protein